MFYTPQELSDMLEDVGFRDYLRAVKPEPGELVRVYLVGARPGGASGDRHRARRHRSVDLAFLGGRTPQFVYFGGGTPSYLSAKQLAELTAGLKSAIPWDAVEEVIARTEDFSSNLTATMMFTAEGTVVPFELDVLGGPTQILAIADEPSDDDDTRLRKRVSVIAGTVLVVHLSPRDS